MTFPAGLLGSIARLSSMQPASVTKCPQVTLQLGFQQNQQKSVLIHDGAEAMLSSCCGISRGA